MKRMQRSGIQLDLYEQGHPLGPLCMRGQGTYNHAVIVQSDQKLNPELKTRSDGLPGN